MNQSEQLNELAAALVAAQENMPGIEKDATGHGYKYASLDNIMAKVRPVLTANGLTVIQQPVGGSDGAIGLSTRLLHKSGQWIEETVFAPRDEGKRRNSVQAAGSTVTYLRRYGIAALLGLADETDTDAVQDTSNGAKSPQKPVETPTTQKGNTGQGRSWPGEFVSALVEQGLAEHPKHAVNMLNLSDFDQRTPLSDILNWAKERKE